jgi:hypothetical protein
VVCATASTRCRRPPGRDLSRCRSCIRGKAAVLLALPSSMHPGTATVMPRTSSALLLSPVQANVDELRRQTSAWDELRASAGPRSAPVPLLLRRQRSSAHGAIEFRGGCRAKLGKGDACPAACRGPRRPRCRETPNLASEAEWRHGSGSSHPPRATATAAARSPRPRSTSRGTRGPSLRRFARLGGAVLVGLGLRLALERRELRLRVLARRRGFRGRLGRGCLLGRCRALPVA